MRNKKTAKSISSHTLALVLYKISKEFHQDFKQLFNTANYHNFCQNCHIAVSCFRHQKEKCKMEKQDLFGTLILIH